MTFGSAGGDADVAGTVVESTAGAKSVTGGATDFGGTDGAAQFEVESDNPGEFLNCTLPGSITVTSGANNMTVDTFTANPLLSNIMPPGQDKINVDIGATVHLAAGQAAGSYSGSVTLTCGSQSDSANVTITIVAPISISNTGSLDFGKVAPTGAAGTVTITAAGARSAVNVDLVGGGTVGAAGFSVTGEGSTAYAITLPSSATLTGPGTNMTVDTFTHDAGGSPALAAGGDSFNVGATLHVGASQAAGAYTGTFPVTVSYN